MIYIVIRQKTEKTQKAACLIKADSSEQALKMVGCEGETANCAVFTDSELSALGSTTEGYIVGLL